MNMVFHALWPNVLQKAVWFPLRPFFKFFIHFRIEGEENVKKLPAGVIFASNHTSEFDPILIPAATPFWSPHIPFFYTSRRKEWYRHLGWYARILYGGLFFKIWGAYPVEAGTHDYAQALGTHAGFLAEGHTVCIFPEGKIQQYPRLGEARGGVAYLAWRTDKPIIPVAIVGAQRMSLFDLLARKRTVTIRFGLPLYKRELFAFCGEKPVVNDERNDFTASAHTVMNAIGSLLAKQADTI